MNCCKQNKTTSLHLHHDKKELHFTHFLKSGADQGQISLAKEEMSIQEEAKQTAGCMRPVKVFRGTDTQDTLAKIFSPNSCIFDR